VSRRALVHGPRCTARRAVLAHILPALGALLLLQPLASRAVDSKTEAYRPAHGSEVLWDRYGVAHVYAKSVPDLFYGFGWAQARSHGELLARMYAQARGRAAEYYGAEGIPNDRWMAVNDVPARARRWLAQQSVSFRVNLVAFAAGANAYEASHAEEFSPEARAVFPVSALDVIAHAQRLFQFVYGAPAQIVENLPPATSPEQDRGGSNGWAIAPSRSANGHALLLMNPHVRWMPDWSTYWAPDWYTYTEVQLTAPGIDLYGATQVGLPVLRFVFSDYLGFTHTVNELNGVTFYRIVPASTGYRFDGKVLPYQERTQTIKVRQSDGTFTTETLTVRATVHGPIVAQRDGAPIAMRVAGLEHPFALEQYWQMATAHDFVGFQRAVARLQVPAFNVVYADRDGHIEYLYNGLVPRHTFGTVSYWSSTVPGDTSKTLWNDYLRYDELPKVIDPPGGTVQNSNNPPWDTAWPTVIDPAPYAASIPADSVSLRMARGIRMLAETPKFSFDQLITDQGSNRSELADRVLPDLLEATARYGDELARQAAQVLAHWDRTTDADSRGALLFFDWTDQPGGLKGDSPAGFARPLALGTPLTTPAGLADPQGAVRALEAAARHTLANYGALDTPWGQVMRLRIVDLPASGAPGNLGVFDAMYFDPLKDGTRTAIGGASYVALVSFAQPVHAKVLMTYGESSQPGSQHASDQLSLLSTHQMRDAWRTRSEVEANLERRDPF
jgi:acyl-homoserine-lactone acylase